MVGADDLAGMGCNHVRIGGKTPLQFSDDRIGRIYVKIDHRTEIEIDAGPLKTIGNDICLMAGQGEVVFVAQSRKGHRGRKAGILL